MTYTYRPHGNCWHILSYQNQSEVVLPEETTNKRKKETSPQPWYADGLRFSCLRCGDCCRGEPGYVWITQHEIKAAAEHLKIPLDKFTRRYVRKVGRRFSLIELSNGDCIFWSPDGCRIYPVRPKQCQTFPFWPEYLRSPDAWLAVQSRCPGVGTGKKYTRDEIMKKLKG